MTVRKNPFKLQHHAQTITHRCAGALHHVIIRAIERQAIFKDDIDRDDFLDRVDSLFVDSSTPLLCLVTDDQPTHLLIRTANAPLATLMRRLLTGYAIAFNRRHRRHGQLFQNRYKSILCQEDAYLLELTRYIHLNLLRAGIVDDLDGLDGYRYSGHSVIMGHQKRQWQDGPGRFRPCSPRPKRQPDVSIVRLWRMVSPPDGVLKWSAADWFAVSAAGNRIGRC